MNIEIIISILRAVFWIISLLTLISILQKITPNFVKWNKRRLKTEARKAKLLIISTPKYSFFTKISLLFVCKVTYVILLNQLFKVIE